MDDRTSDKIKLLLVEDHVIVRQGTRQLLEQEEDMQVVGEAGDGETAVRLAKELRPDVVILDVALPGMSGIEVTKQIKSLLPTTAVLALSAYDYDEFVFALLESGAAGYLLKSISGDDLTNAIRAVHSGEPVLHPVVVRKLVERLRVPSRKPTEVDLGTILSGRELEVLRLASKGIRNKEIADGLFLSVRTVQAHLRSIFNKLGVASRSEAVLYCLKTGWCSLDDYRMP